MHNLKVGDILSFNTPSREVLAEITSLHPRKENMLYIGVVGQCVSLYDKSEYCIAVREDHIRAGIYHATKLSDAEAFEARIRTLETT